MSVTCPFCGGKAIYRFRRDSDWGGGSDYEKVNKDIDYEENAPADEYERPDIDLYHCRRCDSFFDDFTREPAPRSGYVSLTKMRQKILNLQEQLAWNTSEYKKSCESVRLAVQKTADKDMVQTLQSRLPELEQKSVYLAQIAGQIEILEYLCDQDADYPADPFEKTSVEKTT